MSIALGSLLVLAGVAVAVGIGARGSGTPAAKPPASSVARPGAVDVGFGQDMTAHHTQAILMADDVVTRADPQIRTVALGILTEQSQEAGTMKGWLAVWNEPQLPSGARMRWMHSAAHGASMPHMATTGAMPGMASQSELDRLTTDKGRALDVAFLQLMIRHHQGGIAMASYAARHANTALVRSTAAEMVLEQTNENTYMLGLLKRLGGTPLPLS